MDTPNLLGIKTEVSVNVNITEEEKNEEILGLLACLNEQATKELNSESTREIESGKQKLLKAYRILIVAKAHS